MTFYVPQFERVIRSSLMLLEPHIPVTDAAVELLLGTAAVESQAGTYLAQINGPALGVFQMEPATYDDIWNNYMSYKQALYDKIRMHYLTASPQTMIYDLRYATIMARIHYRRVPAALPQAGDRAAQAAYWKRFYNTHLGKGTEEKYLQAWEKHIGEE